MLPSLWEEKIKVFRELVMKPFVFNDLSITLVDAVTGYHQANASVGMHRHPWFEFNYVTEGSFHIHMEGCEFLTPEGHFVLVPPGVFHCNRHSMENNGFGLRWQLEAVDGSEGIKNGGMARHVIEVLSVPRPYSTRFPCEMLVRAASGLGVYSLQVSFLQWLMSIYDLWKQEEESRPDDGDQERHLAHQAVLYMSEYYRQNFRVQDLADALNVSYRHLARIFKGVTGITLVEKMNDIRVNEARRLLLETGKTIHEIAEETGFENEYYFSTIFRRHAHMPPAKFRNKFKALHDGRIL